MLRRKRSKSRAKLFILLCCFVLISATVIGCSSSEQATGTKNAPNGNTEQISTAELADKQNHNHSQAGLSCNQCHGENLGTPVSQDQCLSCHGSMETVAAKTEAMEPNPHGPHHYDTADCTVCHRVHEKSEMMCATCHNFPWINELDQEKWETL